VNSSRDAIGSDGPRTRLAIRRFDLVPDGPSVIFFAESESDLPDNEVFRELRFVAHQERNDADARGITSEIIPHLADLVLGGVVGNAAWGLCKAVVGWVHRRKPESKPRLDLGEITARLRAACREVDNGAASCDITSLAQRPDGTWHATLTVAGKAVDCHVEPSGSVTVWEPR
jgi:hypothetical protein